MHVQALLSTSPYVHLLLFKNWWRNAFNMSGSVSIFGSESTESRHSIRLQRSSTSSCVMGYVSFNLKGVMAVTAWGMDWSLKSVCMYVYAWESQWQYLCVQYVLKWEITNYIALCLFTSSILCARPSERTRWLCTTQSSLFSGHSMNSKNGTSVRGNFKG